MTLQEILFGKFVPPTVTQTRVIQIGFSECDRYVPNGNHLRRNTNDISASAQKMLDRLKHQIKPVTADVMAKKMKISLNYAQANLSELFKTGKATRHRTIMNGLRYYVYEAKKC